MKKPKPFSKPVYVTRPMLRPLSEFIPALEEVWQSGWLTNGGPKHHEFEAALAAALRAPHLSLFNNGTIALIVACQALRLSGEVITSPFTFPATPHVLSWNGITPVFADIHPETLTLDPAAIEPLVTARTTGILGVHVYGMPCHVQAIQRIADTYGLRVVYDGAHVFGTEVESVPLTDYGDATMLSFHATKLFHTAEGGALIVKDAALKNRIDFLKNFGIKNEVEVVMPGINGKMNEIQAALGLVNLRHVDAERARRRVIGDVYRRELAAIDGIACFTLPQNVRSSEQYFIVRIARRGEAGLRDRIYHTLKSYNIFTRRYFYPLCSDANCYSSLPSAAAGKLPVARAAASEVLALPYYGDLGEDGAQRVCSALVYELGA
ncbi:MAG: DegT/DnrJ/EryC1/StrS family aminotransferase [Hyphomicrobiaceae bacterium]